MALNAAHTETYDVSAAKAWKMIGAWSAPYITAANSPAAIKDLKGDGVGATRLVYMLDGSAQWNEEIVEYDAAGMSWQLPRRTCRCRSTSSTKTPSGAR